METLVMHNPHAQAHMFETLCGLDTASHLRSAFDDGTLIASRWKLQRELGAGGFGTVYRAQDMHCTPVAVKTEKLKRNCVPALAHEQQVYQLVHACHPGNVVGIPKLHYAGEHAGNAVLVLDLLGPSLAAHMRTCGGSLSKRSVLMVAIQALSRLEHIHAAGIVHGDVKPANLLTGVGPTAHIIHAVDFGLSIPYKDPTTQKHYPVERSGGASGTLPYMSRSCTRGWAQSRRDDVESLLYTLVKLYRGELPWEKLVSKNTIISIKEGLGANGLCHNMGHGLLTFGRGVWEMRYEHTPKYAEWREALMADLMEEAREGGLVFDWVEERKWSTRTHTTPSQNDEMSCEMGKRSSARVEVETVSETIRVEVGFGEGWTQAHWS